MKIEKCKKCGSTAIFMNKITCGGRGYFAECWDCQLTTKKRFFEKLAWREWNKAMKKICCDNCANRFDENCPNSSECYDLYYKPHFKEIEK